MVLSACGGGVGGSDRTGRTLFDIQEKVSGSCLTAGMALIVKASKPQVLHGHSVASSSIATAISDQHSHSLAGLNERVAYFKYNEMSQSHGYDGVAAAKKKQWRTG